MELATILSFLTASVVLSLMPGPDNIFVLTESISKGQRNGIAISLGLACGVLLHTTLAATGLSILIQQSALAFSILKYLGAAYLFYLAYQTLIEKRPTLGINGSGNKTKDGLFFLLRKGFLMNVLNPKVSLFFIAFLPQFISRDGFNITLQLFILGLIFMLQAIVVFSLIAVLSGKLSRYVNRPNFWQMTKWSKVTILFVLGLTLLLSQHH